MADDVSTGAPAPRAAAPQAPAVAPRSVIVPAPTPLEEAPALAEALQLGTRLLVKRDDLTGPGLGGNKVRKLEYLLADAARLGKRTLLTVGAAQSNHARLTAVTGRNAGFAVHLVLGGGAAEPEGNLLLDELAGAVLHRQGTDDWAELAGALDEVAAELAGGGHDPYVVPMGGSTAVGALGYVTGYAELLAQLDEVGVDASWVVHASSTGGTQAGLLAGRALAGRGPRVYGVDVAKGGVVLRERVRELVGETLALLEAPAGLPAPEVRTLGAAGHGYGELDDATADALLLALRSVGLVADPVYSAKALAGLGELARTGLLEGAEAVVFLHTGGQPALFTGRYRDTLLSRAAAMEGCR